MKSALNWFVIGLALVLITGCAHHPLAGPPPPLITSKPNSMDLIWVTTTSFQSDLATETRFLQDAIYSGLNETKMFACVTQNSPDDKAGGGIKAQAAMKAAKKVSDNARAWRGAWAGQARILVQVTVTDLASGKQIESFEVEGLSGQSAFAGTTNEAIQQAADKIVTELLRLNAQTGG